jgi:hypothetical protein
MPKTVQIRDIDDDVYAALLRRAGEEGITVPELLRREAARLAARPAARPSIASWLARNSQRQSTLSTAEVLESLDEWRGDWPHAGRC